MNEKLQLALAALAEKLGVTIDHLWQIVVNQAFVAGFFDLFFAVFLLSAIIFGGYFVRFIIRKRDADAGLIVALYIICTVIAGMFFIGCTYDAFTEFYNPEYFAFNKIAALLKQ